jgi:hypothetical protein
MLGAGSTIGSASGKATPNPLPRLEPRSKTLAGNVSKITSAIRSLNGEVEGIDGTGENEYNREILVVLLCFLRLLCFLTLRRSYPASLVFPAAD